MKVKHRLPLLMAKNDIKSLRQLSSQTNIDYATLYNFNTYIHKKIDPELTYKLCEALHCDIGDLYFLDEGEMGFGSGRKKASSE